MQYLFQLLYCGKHLNNNNKNNEKKYALVVALGVQQLESRPMRKQ